MKHLLRGLWIVALILCCNFQQVFEQQMPPIPVDKNVRIGKLDNGLTYYIRKKSQPANRADFYIAQKVGSSQEEADQRGLAHFLEHMCFNGTTHFPGDALKQYLDVYKRQQPFRVKHLLIDEMQDYSPIQYKVIQKLFPCRKTVLGDAGPVSYTHLN